MEDVKGLLYQKLEEYLRNQQWYEADQETWRLMLKVTNREEEGYLDRESIENFPCDDLRELDRLWVEESKKHGYKFGFSVQKQIYVECGGKLDFSYPSDEVWEKFCDRTAWKKDGKYVKYPDNAFEERLMSKDGHLPWKKKFTVFGMGFMVREEEVFLLASRLVKCKA